MAEPAPPPRTCLIASGAFVDPELEAEFGRLPPAFLPLGNRRLFEHQCAALAGRFDRLVLSVPEEFEPDAEDLAALQALGCELVGVPSGLSLGQSLVYVINVTASSRGEIAVLHGDTLLQGLDLARGDVVSVGAAPLGYRWGQVRAEEGRLVEARTAGPSPEVAQPGVLSGYFCFADVPLFVQSVTRRGGDFLAALTDYAARRPVALCEAEAWFDLGHVSTYHRSRRRMTTERGFNRLEPGRRSVVKTGLHPRKIEAEARWFEGLPPRLRLHTPAFLGSARDEAGQARYEIEYLHLPTLADLFVFGRLPVSAWGAIFEACGEFLSACAAHPAPAEEAGAAAALYGEKTLARLEAFARAAGLSLDAPCRFDGTALPSLRGIAEQAAAAIPPAAPDALRLVHGDFCFSNILYDVRAGLIRVIDPRGLDARGRITPFGDARYEVAKLHHSVIGRYDHILAGRCRLRRDGPLDLALELPGGAGVSAIEALFLDLPFGGMRPVQAAAPAIAVLLFLSMLPLHADAPQRQAALLANALRLFRDLDTRRGGPA